MFHARINSGFIEVTGDDRIDFVHGLVSNDVRGLTEGSGSGALLLNYRGHALAQMTVVRLADRLLIAVEDDRADWVLAEFDRHIIFDQVKLVRNDTGWTQLTVQGEASAAAAEAARNSGDVVAAVHTRRSAAGGLDLFVKGDGAAVEAALADAGAVPTEPAGLDFERVAGLVAAAAKDAGDGVLPQESGLEHLVSYRKGCYLGQEIMARIEARGKMRRGLRRIRLAARPEGERDIRVDGRLVGKLGTTASDEGGGWTALAVLRLDLAEDAVLEVAGTTASLAD